MSTNVELSGIEVLSAPQCRQLLAQGCVGRVGFVAGGRPHVLPVNYAADDSGVVVFRTGAGSLLMAAPARMWRSRWTGWTSRTGADGACASTARRVRSPRPRIREHGASAPSA